MCVGCSSGLMWRQSKLFRYIICLTYQMESHRRTATQEFFCLCFVAISMPHLAFLSFHDEKGSAVVKKILVRKYLERLRESEKYPLKIGTNQE